MLAALNKHWRSVTKEQYLYDMDWVDVQNAFEMFNLDERTFNLLMDWIWKKERKPFEMFKL